MRVFVSYSRNDAVDFAEHIYRFLRDKEYDVFIDVNSIKIGEPWANSIENNVAECDIFLIILTPFSLTSPNVENEVLQAQKQEKIIVPCIYKDVAYNSIKWGLEKVQGIEFTGKYDLARTLPLKISSALSDSILNKPESLPTIREEKTKETKSLLNDLKNTQDNTINNFKKKKFEIVKFDYSMPADRLLFYIQLLEYLTNSNEVFLNQNGGVNLTKEL